MKSMIVCIMAILVVFLPVSESAESLTCKEAVNPLVPCLSYMTGEALHPDSTCCEGVKHLNKLANTAEIRREVCKCIIEVTSSMDDLTDSTIEDLPSKCDTPLSFRTSRNIDCNKIP